MVLSPNYKLRTIPKNKMVEKRTMGWPYKLPTGGKIASNKVTSIGNAVCLSATLKIGNNRASPTYSSTSQLLIECKNKHIFRY